MKKTKDCAHEYLYPLDKLMHEDEIDKNLKMQCKKCGMPCQERPFCNITYTNKIRSLL